jgi:hypothetical protein
MLNITTDSREFYQILDNYAIKKDLLALGEASFEDFATDDGRQDAIGRPFWR